MVKELQPLIWHIEHLAPALSGDGPNAEYPGSAAGGAAGTRLAPMEYDFPNVEPDSVRFRKPMRLVRLFLEETRPAYMVGGGRPRHGNEK